MAANFEIEMTRIEVGKPHPDTGEQGYFTVRGMNSEDVTFLTIHYLEDMKATVAKYADKGVIQKSAVADLVMAVAKDFPSMAVEIISRCAESTTAEDVAKFRRLSFVKQIEALRAITILTAEDGGIDLGKILGVVASLLEANGLKPGPLMSSLQNTIAMSGKTSAS